MVRKNPHHRPALSPWVLRRADQFGVAAALVVACVAMAAWWSVQGGLSGRLIELDRAEPQSAQFEVDLNEADWPELTQLPNIGETLARRIVQSREQEGSFLDNEDLMRVRGIGPKTLEGAMPYLTPRANHAVMAGGDVGVAEPKL